MAGASQSENHGVPRTAESGSSSNLDRKKTQREIARYQSLVEDVNDRFRNGSLDKATFDLTSSLLKWNPEYYTVWNQRRTILQHLITASLQEHEAESTVNQSQGESAKELFSADLEFLVPLLRKFPKCYWIWNYRLWLLETTTEFLPMDVAISFWQKELYLASKMLTQDSRNFHAWGYRRKALGAIEMMMPSSIPTRSPSSPSAAEISAANSREDSMQVSLTEKEFEYTTRMINANLSNFSAWHHRSKILPRLLSERNASDDDRRQFLDAELDLLERALYTGDNDQSLWFYHQNMMSTFDPSYGARSLAPNLSREERIQYVQQELEKVTEMLDGAEDCKWIYQALIELSLLNRKLAGTLPVGKDVVAAWIAQLQHLDPLRMGRWHDLKTSFSISD